MLDDNDLSDEALSNTTNMIRIQWAVILVLVVMCGSLYKYGNNAEIELGVMDEMILDRCIYKTSKGLAATDDEFDYSEILNISLHYCHELSYTALTLEDFRIRKRKFVDQANSEPILLATVVFITLSGVSLAMYQVYISFKLAGTVEQANASLDTELTAHKDSGIIIRSSVTGLLILIVSFAFFFLYIRYVYKIEFVKIDVDSDRVVSGDVPVVGASNTLPSTFISSNVGDISPDTDSK